MTRKKTKKVVVVMPAYNAARTVIDTFKEIPQKYREQVILVDDQSRDNTVAVSNKLGIKTFAHPNNVGYGGNQKTCYWEALKLNPDVIVMLHPDYQYDASKIGDLIVPILNGEFDYMFGSRIKNRGMALKGGMPKLKYYINRLVCFVQNILLGENFSEYFSGLRAYSNRLLKIVPFQRFSNDFVFDQEMTISAISYNMRIGETPIITRYHEKQSSIGFFKGVKFILDGFGTISRYLLHKAGIVNDKRFAPGRVKKTFRLKIILSLSFLALINIFVKPSSSQNIWLEIFVFSQSALLLFLIEEKLQNALLRKIVLLALPILVSIFVVGSGIYKDTFKVTNFEKNQLWVRQELYRRELGLLGRSNFGNKSIENTKLVLDKITQKITESYELNHYFSTEAFSFYPLFLLPLFALGFLFMLAEKIKLVLYCLGLATIGAILIPPDMTYWLFIPLINLGLLLGVKNIKNLLKVKKE